MKYIYYVIAVMVVFSGLAAFGFGLFDAKVQISKPFISVNDRIISEDEFERMLHRKPAYMTKDQFINSVIEKQLLIQEAIKLEINKEENFRLSVENFYEQSLIKILLDRKLDSLLVDVSSDEIEKYRIFLNYRFIITKRMFPTLADAYNNTNPTIEKMSKDFIDLSDDLKFTMMNLDIGKSSPPEYSRFGFVVYTLEAMQKRELSQNDPQDRFDIKKVSLYIRDKKKEKLLDEWTAQIRESSEIWPEKWQKTGGQNE